MKRSSGVRQPLRKLGPVRSRSVLKVVSRVTALQRRRVASRARRTSRVVTSLLENWRIGGEEEEGK